MGGGRGWIRVGSQIDLEIEGMSFSQEFIRGWEGVEERVVVSFMVEPKEIEPVCLFNSK